MKRVRREKFSRTPKGAFPPWTLKDKKNLLSALREYGCNDFEVLARALNRDTDDVRNMVTSIKARAEVEVARSTKQKCIAEGAPIEEWRNLLYRTIPYNCRQNDYAAAMGKLFLEASKQYPDRQSQHEPSFRCIYSYLSCIMTNSPAPELSSIESAIVMRLFQQLSKTIKSLSLTREWNFLETWQMKKIDCSDDADVSGTKAVKESLVEAKQLPEAIAKGDDGGNPDASCSSSKKSEEPDKNALNLFYARKFKLLLQSLNPLQVPIDMLHEVSIQLQELNKDS